MATFKIIVFKHQQRQDEKFPVSIRLTWKRKHSYIKTAYYVTSKQVDRRTFAIKDIYILNDLNNRIAQYEEIKAKKLGLKIELYTAKELAEYFVKETAAGTSESIDFIEFSRDYIEKLKSAGRNSYASNMNRTINSIIDFVNGRENLKISEITAIFLNKFEEFLKTERKIKRKNQFGRSVTTVKQPVSDTTIFDYMTDIRVLFNAARDQFNDEDKGELRIIHYPFRKYKIKPKPENVKRNLTREQIIAIRDVSDQELVLERAIIARDVFMISFYLVGMNMADIYEANRIENVNGEIRLNYERVKTRGRRSDHASISIRIEPEAMELLEKYKDKTGKRVFNFYKRYSTSHVFGSNINKGLKTVAEACKIDIPLSTYYARHSWATIARNKCNVSRDDVDLALNHVDQRLRIADMYIEKDWSRIDEANRKVIDYII